MSTTEEFLAGGGSVCPFARNSRRIYARIGAEPAKARGKLFDAAAEFRKTKGATPNAALLVVGPGWAPFDVTKIWAREVFLELMMAFGLGDGGDPRRMRVHIQRTVRPMLYNDAHPRRPMLGCADEPLFSICVSPLYPKGHPRYAPETAVVVTWQSDVARAQSEPVTERIREVMHQEHGFVYDADDLMLPLPTRATETP